MCSRFYPYVSSIRSSICDRYALHTKATAAAHRRISACLPVSLSADLLLFNPDLRQGVERPDYHKVCERERKLTEYRADVPLLYAHLR